MAPLPIPGSSKKRSDDENRESAALWKISGMGFTMASEILAGTGIGWALDHWFGTSPKCLIGGTIAGVLVGITTFLKSALQHSQEAARNAPHMPRRDLSHLDPTDEDGADSAKDEPID